MKPGDRYRVKSTPITRRYGVRTHGAFQAPADCKAWPGDVGIVTERTRTTTDGHVCTSLHLAFDRGRCISLPFDLEDFVRVRK